MAAYMLLKDGNFIPLAYLINELAELVKTIIYVWFYPFQLQVIFPKPGESLQQLPTTLWALESDILG